MGYKPTHARLSVRAKAAAVVGAAAVAAGAAAIGAGPASAATAASVTSHVGPGYIVNVNSGKALDVTGGEFAAGTTLQQWTKGAKGLSGVAGADQQFEILNESDGTSYLVAVAPDKTDYYVTSSEQGTLLTLSTNPSAGAVMKKSGPYYEFPNTGLVMDVVDRSTTNGAHVQGWKLLDGTNQQWSLP